MDFEKFEKKEYFVNRELSWLKFDERGDRSPARDHRFRHVVDSSLFYLSAVTVVFHRDHAPAVGAGRRGGMLGAVRLAVNPRLEPFPLAQRAAAVDSE